MLLILKFTFHYVSISTTSSMFIAGHLIRFTFHYVSISTVSIHEVELMNGYLHSTMYLFQPDCTEFCRRSADKFTFHYVSISTLYSPLFIKAEANLHSTMYLFQLCASTYALDKQIHLHSTMYLFQHISLQRYNRTNHVFTFHYVSISTPDLQKPYIY